MFFSFLVFSYHILTPVALGSQEKTNELKNQDEIRRLNTFLSRFKKRYQLFTIDTFETKRSWSSRGNSSMLSHITYIKKTPNKLSFIQEQKLMQTHIQGSHSFQHSLNVQTSFEIPGRQTYQLNVGERIQIPAQPVQLSLWVHSQNYKHVLYLTFLTIRNKRVEQKITKLDFDGWKRFKVNLPSTIFKRPKYIPFTKKHVFKGFLIKSHPKEKAGAISIKIDNILVVCDLQELLYPGSQIKDIWE